MTRFSAPGKLVLAGEYAVVDGHPAIVAAVSRRAVATLEPGGGDDLRVRGNDPRWVDALEARREQPLLAAVLDEVAEDARARGLRLPPCRVAVSTSAFASDGKKLGLGSSAAAAVAFTAALLHAAREREHAAGDVDARAVHRVARAAHRAFQGGGSGIDVAASAFGGLVSFRLAPESPDGVAVAPAPPIPDALDVVVAWTGVPAKTQGFVDAWRALPSRADHARAIAASCARFAAGCASSDVHEVLQAIDAARGAMQAMGRAAGIDVVTAAHERVAQIARAHGGAAKPSGAGGGDVAVCFVPRDARASLVAALEAAQLEVVDVRVGDAGVRVDELDEGVDPAPAR